MRLGLFAILFIVLIFISTLLIPVGRPVLAVPAGSPAVPPTGPRCVTLTYTGLRRPDVMPHKLKLLSDRAPWLFGRQSYKASGDGDPLWKEGLWLYAGPDSIDILAHHQPMLRIPAEHVGAAGRGVPYIDDGTLFVALLQWHQGPFRVWSRFVPCNP